MPFVRANTYFLEGDYVLATAYTEHAIPPVQAVDSEYRTCPVLKHSTGD